MKMKTNLLLLALISASNFSTVTAMAGRSKNVVNAAEDLLPFAKFPNISGAINRLVMQRAGAIDDETLKIIKAQMQNDLYNLRYREMQHGIIGRFVEANQGPRDLVRLHDALNETDKANFVLSMRVKFEEIANLMLDAVQSNLVNTGKHYLTLGQAKEIDRIAIRDQAKIVEQFRRKIFQD